MEAKRDFFLPSPFSRCLLAIKKNKHIKKFINQFKYLISHKNYNNLKSIYLLKIPKDKQIACWYLHSFRVICNAWTQFFFIKKSITRLAWSSRVDSFCWADFVGKLTRPSWRNRPLSTSFSSVPFLFPQKQTWKRDWCLRPQCHPHRETLWNPNSPQTHPLACSWGGWCCEARVCEVHLVVKVSGLFLSRCLKFLLQTYSKPMQELPLRPW